MKRIHLHTALFVIAMLVLVLSRVIAQPRGGMMMSPEERAKQLQERIGLTDEQTAKVAAIYQASQKEFSEKMPDLMGDREAMRKAMTAMTEKTDKEIEKLLTKQQAKKYEDFKKERRQRLQQMQRRQNDQ